MALLTRRDRWTARLRALRLARPIEPGPIGSQRPRTSSRSSATSLNSSSSTRTPSAGLRLRHDEQYQATGLLLDAGRYAELLGRLEYFEDGLAALQGAGRPRQVRAMG